MLLLYVPCVSYRLVGFVHVCHSSSDPPLSSVGVLAAKGPHSILHTESRVVGVDVGDRFLQWNKVSRRCLPSSTTVRGVFSFSDGSNAAIRCM